MFLKARCRSDSHKDLGNNNESHTNFLTVVLDSGRAFDEGEINWFMDQPMASVALPVTRYPLAIIIRDGLWAVFLNHINIHSGR